MKAVIVGVQGRYAAALTEDGCVTRVRNRGYTLGQTVEPSALIVVSPLKKAVPWVAAAAAAVFICTGGVNLYFAPYAYVSIDVNPSVEYVLNRFDRVLEVTAVNEDGTELLEGVQLTNKPIDDAVRETLGRMAESGYFEDAKPNGLVIAASCQNEKASEKLALRLEQSVQEETSSLHATVEVATVTVPQDRVAEAKDLGVTPGKLGLVEQLKESVEDPDSVDIQQWISQPVVEIMNEIKASQEGQPPTSSDSSDPSSAESELGESSAEEESWLSSEEIPSDISEEYGESSEEIFGESSEESEEFLESSADLIESEPASEPMESDWESSLPEEFSRDASDDTSELADVGEPKGKPISKPSKEALREEVMNGPPSLPEPESSSEELAE